MVLTYKDGLEAFSDDDSKIEKMLDWFEYQMTRDDLRLK